MINPDEFNRALELWLELTDLDPNAKSFTWEKLGLLRMSENLREATDLDPSLITTYLLLDAYSTAYFKDAKVSVHEFDEDPDKVFDYMDKVREFKKLIRNPDIMDEAEAFCNGIADALRAYKVEEERIEEFMQDRHEIAYLRLDTLVSMKNLRADHFLNGDTDPEGTKPLYNEKVFGYWNINSMLDHVCAMPSGVSLNLIRDPDELHSYFIFAIRNGGNLITLTDMTEYAHPLGRYMSRRPDRTFDRRAGQNWFPYQMLQIAFDDKGNAYHDIWSESKEKGLVPHQPNYFVLAPVTDMDIKQIVWMSLMFDRIVDRYWRKPIEPKALSYTNEMLKLGDRTNPLLAAAASSNLPIDPYAPPPLQLLDLDDVHTDALDAAAVGEKNENFKERYGRNRWMEDRYRDTVPTEVLNLIGLRMNDDKEKLYLMGSVDEEKRKNRWSKDDKMPVPIGDGEIVKIAKDSLWYTRDYSLYSLEQVDGTLFGPVAQLDADRKFIARVNYVKALQRSADEEFAARKEEVKAWYEERVKANMSFLVSLIAQGQTKREYDAEGFGHSGRTTYVFSDVHDDARAPKKTAEWDRRVKLDADPYWFGSMESGQVWLHSGYSYSTRNFSCFINEGVRSSLTFFAKPEKVQDIADLAGCTIEELPELLQHWHSRNDSAYVGNSILNRIDPLEWALHNPWEDLNFSVKACLSRSAYNKIMKENSGRA